MLYTPRLSCNATIKLSLFEELDYNHDGGVSGFHFYRSTDGCKKAWAIHGLAAHLEEKIIPNLYGSYRCHDRNRHIKYIVGPE